jgi:hypothetical protein
MFQARNQDRAVAESGARVGEHVGDERAGGMLSQKVGPEKRLPQQGGDHP